MLCENMAGMEMFICTQGIFLDLGHRSQLRLPPASSGVSDPSDRALRALRASLACYHIPIREESGAQAVADLTFIGKLRCCKQ